MNKIYKKYSFRLPVVPSNVSLKLLFYVLLTVFIAACGGGGGEDSGVTITPAVPASLTLVVDDQDISIEENAPAIILVNVNYTGSKTLVATLSDVNIDGLSVSQSQEVNNFEITLLASDLTGSFEETGELTITVSDGTVSDTTTVAIRSSNTSYLQLVEQTSLEIEALESFDVSDEFTKVTLYAADKAYLYGLMTYDEKVAWLEDMGLLLADIQSTATIEAQEILVGILEQQTELSESDAISLSNQAMDSLAAAGAKFDSLSTAIDSLSIPNFTSLASFKITQYQGQYSLFYGNDAYGVETNNEWTFAEKWALLERLLSFAPQSCPVNNV
ncbi:hypothetical protein [uncultured Paraglaciecola sp.]|mgnify:CR=1 FL=1|uniref:hypothetical protein n=1 Tax=uncultured Paraglaciecola sp. TaxID=1765024 RepID=UPI0030D959AF|tara:strand:+ start:54540 stop:55529 length:990 start_codon:yes stop_codon:yes gene_type:complete